MAAKPERKTLARKNSHSSRTSKIGPVGRSAYGRTAQIGRFIALGSLIAAGMLIVVGAGAIALLATEPTRRSGKWGGWNFNDLSNSARDRLRANLPDGWTRAVREDLVPGARQFVARQTRHLL
ncbi:MAG TPA: hypothetical protein VG891_01280 [Rhizomicrobium sp.]|nr:hypothetical protein [Rhizomicrobium sp.]